MSRGPDQHARQRNFALSFTLTAVSQSLAFDFIIFELQLQDILISLIWLEFGFPSTGRAQSPLSLSGTK